MTCYECMHINVCKAYEPEDADCICNQFKNKADFVEVVRCVDCKHLCRVHSCVYRVDGIGYKNVSPDDFCSYGERK